VIPACFDRVRAYVCCCGLSEIACTFAVLPGVDVRFTRQTMHYWLLTCNIY
jgi:hypothetical protein